MIYIKLNKRRKITTRNENRNILTRHERKNFNFSHKIDQFVSLTQAREYYQKYANFPNKNKLINKDKTVRYCI